MKTIKILRLTLDNFKCYAHFQFAPEGANCGVFGANGTGKSTLYDAFTWLLFGKDSRGNSSPDLKPHDGAGQVRDHQAVTSVEGVLWVDGKTVSLRRTYFEKWSTQRGGAQEKFDGHSSDFFVDGVPVKKNEFTRRVAEIMEEDLFRLLTNVHYFCGTLGWKERRAALFGLVQVEPDEALMGEREEFAPLLAALDGLTPEDLGKKLQARRKGLTVTRNELPARLDECKKTVEELQGVDFDALRGRLEDVRGQREALAADLLRMERDTLTDKLRNDRDRLRNEVEALRQRNEAHRRAQEVPGPDLDGLERAVRRAENILADGQKALAACREDEVRYTAEIDACRGDWHAANSRTFDGADCPTCGRALTGEMLEQARREFESRRQKDMEAAVRASQGWKDRLTDVRRRAETLDQAVEGYTQERDRLEAQLREARTFAAPAVEDLPGYEAELGALQARLEKAEAAITAHASDGAAARREVQNRVRELDGEIGALQSELAREQVLSYTRERMDTLREDAAKAARELSDVERLLHLLEQFTRYKAERASESVNRRFSLVRWKLFEEQVNGGLAECCAATVDGSEYGNGLNDGGMVKAGLDVISAFSLHYGVRVPLFIDNAESVTGLPDTGTQTVRLVVSENDRELRCEYGT